MFISSDKKKSLYVLYVEKRSFKIWIPIQKHLLKALNEVRSKEQKQYMITFICSITRLYMLVLFILV